MSNGEMFAVKQVEKENHNTHRLNFVSELKMEAEILRGLRHPHIVAYLGSEETTVFLNMYVVRSFSSRDGIRLDAQILGIYPWDHRESLRRTRQVQRGRDQVVRSPNI